MIGGSFPQDPEPAFSNALEQLDIEFDKISQIIKLAKVFARRFIPFEQITKQIEDELRQGESFIYTPPTLDEIIEIERREYEEALE